jgi:SAM-dependent methyltransferase
MNYTDLPEEDVYATTKKICFVLDNLHVHQKKQDKRLKILDFGCGNASQLGQFIINRGYDYLGVDYHVPSIEFAQHNYSAESTRFLTKVPAQEKFDVIIFSEVLEHLEDPVTVLKNSKLMMSEDGIIIGSIPNGYGLTEIEKYVDSKLKIYRKIRWIVRKIRKIFNKQKPNNNQIKVPYNIESGHVQFFTMPKLNETLKDAGLKLKIIQNGSVMGADLSGVTILTNKNLIALNTKVANFLPKWAAATWHFVVIKNNKRL